MSALNDGGPAFPAYVKEGLAFGQDFAQPGMSLRDWFAGQYVAGNRWTGGTLEELAVEAYSLADEMLAVREKGGKP